LRTFAHAIARWPNVRVTAVQRRIASISIPQPGHAAVPPRDALGVEPGPPCWYHFGTVCQAALRGVAARAAPVLNSRTRNRRSC
jgi:hypothetical protein